jgi:tetratricopeptide (TPR) repeat protein/transcriptional regulator with XRE-family HTH domain
VPPRYGELVHSYRVAAGITQEELAASTGLDVRTIRDIERGRTTRPRRTSADLLARALNRDDLAWEAVRAHLRGITSTDPGSLAQPESGSNADGAHPAQATPRQLPGGVRHFTGRMPELAQLTGLLDQAGRERPGTVVISAIGGTAGVGKTALAVHWAHQASDRFPDGQLYVDLRGYGPGQPVRAADALAAFLRALGVAGQDIALGVDERAAQYRSRLAGQRMLVLLDNARSDEQARPLLPGTSSCVTVVTSRDALPGLVARDGAMRLDLDLLPESDAIELLRSLIGHRVVADPQATRTLAARCCRLPLALRVAAELAAAHPAEPLASLVADLADQRDRLDRLDAISDPATAVRTVFSWSFRHLEPSAARAFQLVGLHPGPDLDHYAAAALIDASTLTEAGRLLGRLARAHLVHSTTPGRYAMHDLLRDYAAELAAAIDEGKASKAALNRLFDYYVHTTALAIGTVYPTERRRLPDTAGLSTPVPPVTSPDAARAWLDGHRAVLISAVSHATDNGWPDHAIQLATTLARHLYTTGYYAEDVAILRCARRAARHCGDQVTEARALTGLGDSALRQGDYQQADRHFRQALTLFRAAGDQPGEARALGNLGMLAAQHGRYQQASRHQRQALALCCAIGDQKGQAVAQARLGEVDLRQGSYLEASTHFQESLALFREVGDPIDQAYALGNLGELELKLGRYQEARAHFLEVLALSQEADDRVNEAYARAELGEVDVRQDRFPQAIRHFERALELLRQAGDRADEAGALNGLGEALLGDGQIEPARTEYNAALTSARETGDTDAEARARRGLGQVSLAAGDPGQARSHWERALALYTRLGAPEADQVQASLRDLRPASAIPAGPAAPG